MLSNELQIGKAGEYLACADLITKGLIAYPSEQGLPYDVVIDAGENLLKCQVKTTQKWKMNYQRAKQYPIYFFHIKRHGKNGLKRYMQYDVDIFALVALDSREVGYLINTEMPASLCLRVEAYRGTYHDEKGIQDHKKVIKLKQERLTAKQIALKLNLHYTAVCKMLKKTYRPFITQSKYFSDIKREKEWFNNVK